MRKVFAFLLAVMMLFCCAACAAEENPEKNNTEENKTEQPVETEPEKVMETDSAKIDGFLVDESYTDTDGKPLKMVYLFLTLKAGDSNFNADSKYTKLQIGENTYESDFYKNACQFMPNYYYSSYIEDVFVGTEFKLALTFKVPEGDLAAGTDVTVSDTSVPVAGLRFSTDDLIKCDSAEAVGAKVDPEGCAEVAKSRELADEATAQKVRDGMNGYYWEFYVTLGTQVTKYELEFYAPNEFEVRTPYLSNSGTYEVHNGYIFLHYTTSDTPVEVRYEYANGEVSLYCSEAFGIYE